MTEDISQLNACLPSPPDERDYMLAGAVSAKIARPAACPAPFDLPDINQFSAADSKYACVACALSGLRHQLSRMQDVVEEYDYVWLYNQCKLIDGLPNLNGTTLKAALEVARKIGVKTTKGKFRKIKEYKKIENPRSIDEIETAIFLYHGILAAYTLSDPGWRNYVVRRPISGETTGGHGTLLNGYAKNILAQDSMPSYHGGDIFEIPKTYYPNEAWAITVDDEIIEVGLVGWVAGDVDAIVSDTVVKRLNLRDSPNGKVIQTLAVGTKIAVVGAYAGKVGGHTWMQVEVDKNDSQTKKNKKS